MVVAVDRFNGFAVPVVVGIAGEVASKCGDSTDEDFRNWVKVEIGSGHGKE
jgi:hypothetical protein